MNGLFVIVSAALIAASGGVAFYAPPGRVQAFLVMGLLATSMLLLRRINQSLEG